MSDFIIDPKVKEFASKTQARYIDAVNEHGGHRAAGAALGVHHTTILRAVRLAQAKAAQQGFSPEHDMTKTTPVGFGVKGTSTLYDADGVLKQQWVKTQRDAVQMEQAMREFVRYLAEDVRGLSPMVAVPEHQQDDIMVVYPMGDPHFGMYAWAEETGDDFDLDIAERLTKGAIDRLVTSAPASTTALLLNLGDFFHADDSSNRTPASGHTLDVDTRYQRVMMTGVKTLVYCVQRLLEKHQVVKVWNNAGNHDPHASFMLAYCLAAFFSNNPPVEVDLGAGLYKYMRFGRVLLGSHHGHGAKLGDLPLLMATDRPEDWGMTRYRYMYVGHYHHAVAMKEHPGMSVEVFRTLAARDAWHAGKGYRAGREMVAIVLHKECGEIERHRCDVSRIDLSQTAKD